jgi:hypothetical protein
MGTVTLLGWVAATAFCYRKRIAPHKCPMGHCPMVHPSRNGTPARRARSIPGSEPQDADDMAGRDGGSDDRVMRGRAAPWHKLHRRPLVAGASYYPVGVYRGDTMISLTRVFDIAVLALGTFNVVLVGLLILSF